MLRLSFGQSSEHLFKYSTALSNFVFRKPLLEKPLPPHRYLSVRARDFEENQQHSRATGECYSRPLGYPLPDDEHACSVSLPKWSDVVGYEEGDPATTTAMKCGYPRFVYHPYVLQVMEYALETYASNPEQQDCLVLPSKEAAVRCQAFLMSLDYHSGKSTAITDNALMEGVEAHDAPDSKVRVVDLKTRGIHAVFFPAETEYGAQAKAYWQHTGEIVSSRRAECALDDLNIPVAQKITDTASVYHSAFDQSPECPFLGMKQRISSWAKLPAEDCVFLTASGMSSIYLALRSARRYQMEQGNRDGGTSIVYGFPYLDTLKMCSRPEFSPGGVEFFGHGNDRDLENLERLLASGKRNIGMLVTEVPSNPLLKCPDLYRLRELADQYDFMLVVDDTISNFLNIDIIHTGLADAVCSSLTKIVSGRGDAMAGSLVANPNTSRGRWLYEDLSQNADKNSGLYRSDAQALLRNSEDFPIRNQIINENSEALSDWLGKHEDVSSLYYPKTAPMYEKVKVGGYGGLMSLILHQNMCQRTFYDTLDVAKGPSLGTNFTLVCPYPLLAHYHELDFAMNYNVPPNLVRVSVGLEPREVLQEKFDVALRKCRLHPRIPT